MTNHAQLHRQPGVPLPEPLRVRYARRARTQTTQAINRRALGGQQPSAAPVSCRTFHAVEIRPRVRCRALKSTRHGSQGSSTARVGACRAYVELTFVIFGWRWRAHVCIGLHFARMQPKAVMSESLGRFRLRDARRFRGAWPVRVVGDSASVGRPAGGAGRALGAGCCWGVASDCGLALTPPVHRSL